MASDVNGTSSEALRMKNYRLQMQSHHDAQVREIQDKNSDEVQRLIENHAYQMDNLRNAYNVQISEEAEAMEQKLHDVRLKNEERLKEEKRIADDAVNQSRSASQKRIEEYRKNSEAQLAVARKEQQMAADNLHAQTKKAARAKKEVPTS